MSEPFLLVQLSDPHIGASWGGRDPVAGLAAAVESVLALDPGPDALLVSGDLAESAADAEYQRARELLASLDAPLFVLPGNHDERGALRRHFGVPGEGAAPVRYAADLGSLRLVVADTTIPGEDGGELDAEQLAWLDRELASAPDAATLVAMHHPPLATGMLAMDAIGLPVADRHALGEVLARHGHVRGLVAGHVHRTIAGALAGRPVVTAPSTFVGLALDFRIPEIRLVPGQAGFAIHALLDGELVSHVQLTGPANLAPT